MTKISQSTNCSKKANLFLISLILIAMFSVSLGNVSDKQVTVENVVEKWISIARLQYNKGYYAQSENSLLRALEYQVHLNPQQIELINKLLEKVRNAKNSITRSVDRIEQARILIQQEKLLEAKGYLKEVLKQKNLEQDDHKEAVDLDKQLDTMIKEQKTQMAQLYDQSVNFYKNGQYEQAREGFVVVAQSGLYKPLFGDSAEKYLEKISEKYQQEADTQEKPVAKVQVWPWVREEEKTQEQPQENFEAETQIIQTKTQNTEIVQIPVVDSTAEPKYSTQLPEKQNSASNIKLDYLNAVISDAEDRAIKYSGRSEFKQALSIIKNAEITLEKFADDIETEDYSVHKNRLDTLKMTVLGQKEIWHSRWDAQAADQ